MKPSKCPRYEADVSEGVASAAQPSERRPPDSGDLWRSHRAASLAAAALALL